MNKALFFAASVLIFFVSASASLASAETPSIEIRVIDAEGNPIPDAQYIWQVLENSSVSLAGAWSVAELEPVIRINSEAFQFATVTVVAPGFAWATRKIELVERDEPVPFVLEKGKQLHLNILPPPGTELPPAFNPLVFGTETELSISNAALTYIAPDDDPSRIRIPNHTRRLGETQFVVNIPADTESFNLIVNQPGFLRGFVMLAVEASDEPITINLPEPATLRVRATPSDSQPAEYDSVRVTLSGSLDFETLPMSVWLDRSRSDNQSIETLYTDLAPAEYAAYIRSGKRGDQDYFETNQTATLEPGASETLDFRISTFDEAYWRNEFKATQKPVLVRLLNEDKSPASGASYRVVVEFRQYDQEIELQSGTAGPDGVLRLDNVPTNRIATLYANGQRMGLLYANKDSVQKDGSWAFEYTVSGAPTGTPAPDLVFRDLQTDELRSLRDFRGKVVLLDFWASWCGPCQPAMKKYNDLAARRGDWDGRAIIIGASIDKKIEAIREHLLSRDWDEVHQVHVERDRDGKHTPEYEAYNVRFIPHTVLIDQRGRIVKRGTFNAEAAIDSLLVPDK